MQSPESILAAQKGAENGRNGPFFVQNRLKTG
jgi:hypothetical protein